MTAKRLYEQEALVSNLQTKVETLEHRYLILESKLTISSHVSDILSIGLDDTNQYSRRNCIVIKGVKTAPNENVVDVENTVNDILTNNLNLPEAATDVDRTHRIGPINKNGEQPIIVKFKSFKHRIDVYRNRKNLPKPLKMSLSLTQRRSQLLQEARDLTENLEAVHFCFYDVNCALKIRLRKKTRGKFVFGFNTKQDLDEILANIDPGMIEFDKIQ